MPENIHREYDHILHIPALAELEVTYYFRLNTSVYDARIFPPHVHDHVEFYVLVEGDASFMVENQLYHLRAGDIVLSRPNEMHHCVLNNRSLHKHLCIWFNSKSDYLVRDFIINRTNIISPNDENKAALLSLYNELEAAGNQNNERLQLSIFLQILDIYSRSMNQNESILSERLQPLPEVLHAILDDINENFISIRSLDYFTEKYFISMSTLNRLFKKYLHTSPKLYIESKRLTYSRQLLKQGKSVLSACIDSGFPDYSNYIRLFKNRFGITPKQYKEQ